MLDIEFTNDTLVQTERGVERLETLLGRDVFPCLWAVNWGSSISFHKSHKLAKDFAAVQMDCVPHGCARLVDVSQSLYDAVIEQGWVVADIKNFSEAVNYEVAKTWKH